MDMDPILIEDDDDDDDAVIIENGEDTKNKAPHIPVQDISVITRPQTNNNEDVIIIEEKLNPKISEPSFKVSLENNQLLDKIVTHCMKCVGMPRVVNKTLLPLYMDADVSYKQSESFRDLLKKTYKLLEKDPNHKFLHIKTLCEGLKGGLRKKVPFVTLTSNLNQEDHYEITRKSSLTTFPYVSTGVKNKPQPQKPHCDTVVNRKRGRPRKYPINDPRSKRRKIQSPIQAKRKKLAKASNTTKVLNATKKIEDIISIDSSDESVGDHNEINEETPQKRVEETNLPKENSLHLANEMNSSNETNKFNKENNKGSGDMQENNVIAKDNDMRDEIINDFEHLIPQSQIEIVFEEPDVVNKARIMALEKEMESYQKQVKIMETCEVNSDFVESPYVQCDKYKRKILECYKKICELMRTDDNLVKRREIRLNVAEGHPAGPAKILERYLNNNIDKATGNVLLPDFVDVMDCVLAANQQDNLGWSNERVVQEASMLFTECATMLRKSRQKREYKDLLSFVTVKEEADDDPADKDPELLAKLEKNKQIAKAREDEVLDRYVRMQNNPVIVHPRVAAVNATVNSEDVSDTEESDLPNSLQTVCDSSQPSESVTKESSNNHVPIAACTLHPNCRVLDGNELLAHATAVFQKTEVLVRNNSLNISNSANCDIIGMPQIKKEVNLDESCKLSFNEVPNFVASDNSATKEDVRNSRVPNESCASVNNVLSVLNNNSDVNSSVEMVKVKTEPLDVQSMLDQLGDNFVCSVFGIEEQYVVIEISDSSSEDES